MIRDYSFKDIEKYLKKDSKIGKDVLTAFDSITDAAILFSPIVFGSQFLPLLELLEMKNKLFELGHKVYDAIAQRIETDYIDRTEQVKASYALICYTAYFDALENNLPKSIVKKLKLKLEKKNELIEKSIEASETPQLLPSTNIHCNLFYADHVNSFSEIKEQLNLIYIKITEGLIKMIADSAIFNDEEEKDRQEFKKIKESVSNIPSEALKMYEAQYISLADQFSDFAVFAQLQNFEGLHYAMKQNKNAIDLLAKNTNKIDVGLNNLCNIVNAISTNYSEIQAQSIVDELKSKYISLINEPIIDDKEIKSDSEMISLRYPKIVDAFIPQSYKCISYTQKGIKLEDVSIWREVPIKHDLDKFFVKYLYSPDSIDVPLIMLGQPGSGKSLLTKVLSAQLMSNSYTVVRIPLRDVNAEDGIDVLVEDQIKKITNRPLSTQGYGGFASQFNEKPLVIILDGYDELLQAKGEIFSSYLEKVRMFQQNQKILNRPVRIIVTSRITLIDKARIPENSTILRLMEFNSKQRQAWIDIWNKTNNDYFINSNIKPFALPKEERNNSIIELAEQPLLLLMLALYDSESNELAQTSNINRTELYDNLLRRFIRRERSRYVPNFEDKPINEQEFIIDEEMKRLGVIAIGMYNRRDVVIHSEELEKDLDAFEAKRKDTISTKASLSEADSVLGGFFFIHKSTAQDGGVNSDSQTNAYEFLHNTFGEFLAADFILRNTITEVLKIYINSVYRPYNASNKAEMLEPDKFSSSWFYCLMFVPLYSRPVVVEMLREHAIRAFRYHLQMYYPKLEMNDDNFVETLKIIVANQLEMVLNTRFIPKVMINGNLFENDMPILGYLSTYTINLVILVSSISFKGFHFYEEEYQHKKEIGKSDLRPWDKLTSLWKAWFAQTDLVGLSVILRAKRIEDKIVLIKCNKKFEATRYEDPVDVLLCISTTLADTNLMALSGLQTPKFCEISQMNDQTILNLLNKESVDFYVIYLIGLLRKKLNEISTIVIDIDQFIDNYYIINKIIDEFSYCYEICNINVNTALALFEVIELCLLHHLITFSNRNKFGQILLKIIRNSKDDRNRENQYLLEIAALKLLQLLIPKGVPLLLDRRMSFNDIIHRNMFIYKDFDENFEDIIHYSMGYYKEGLWISQNLNSNIAFHTSLLNVIQDSSVMRKKDRIKFIKNFISENSLDVLLEIDPELISSAILKLIKTGEFEQILRLSIIDAFLLKCINQLSIIGIFNYGFNTLTNTIEIALNVKNSDFLYEIEKYLSQKLFYNNLDILTYLIEQYPDFIAKLMELVPQIFSENYKTVLRAFRIEQRSDCVIDIKRLLDYIKFFHLFSNSIAKTHSNSNDVSRILQRFSYEVFKSYGYINLDFKQLTLSQIEDLVWWIENIDNTEYSEYLKEQLNYSKLLQYINSDYFDFILKGAPKPHSLL